MWKFGLFGTILLFIFVGITYSFQVCSHSTYFVPLYFLAFIPYSIAFLFLRQTILFPKPLFRTLLLFALLFRIVLLLAPNVLSSDIYRYLWDGIVFKEGFNPYQYAPDAQELAHLAKEYPHHSKINHPHISTIYPPMMQYFFFMVASLSPTIFFFKLMMLCFDFGVIYILIKLLQQSKQPREFILLYAWNPLPIIEFAGNGHNDILAIFFLLLALWSFQKERFFLGAIALTVSFLGKILGIFALFFLPRSQKIKCGIFLCVITLLTLFAFVDEDLSLFRGLKYYGNDLRFNDSIFELLFQWVEPLFDQYEDAIRNTKFLCALFLLSVVAFAHLSKVSLFSGTYALLAMLMIVTTQLHPWYLAWVLPFACFYRHYSWIMLSATIALSYLNIFSYEQTQVWFEVPRLKFWEYFPFYALLFAETIRNFRKFTWRSIHFSYIWGVTFFFCFVLLGGFLVFQGRINLDEGYFLTASKRVQEGKMLYQEVAFTQGPVLPYVYGTILQGLEYSFFSGRVLSYFLACATLLLTLFCAYQRGGTYAVILVSLLCGFNVDYAYFSVLVKTYSLAAFFLGISVFFYLCFPKRSFSLFCATLFSLLAMYTRVSLFPFFFFFLYEFSKISWEKKLFYSGGIGFFFLLGMTYFLFAPASFDSIFFHLVRFHLGYEPEESWWMRHKTLFGYYQETFWSLGVFSLFFLLMRMVYLFKKMWAPEEIKLFFIFIFVWCFHFMLKTSQLEYQVVLYPLASLWVGIYGARCLICLTRPVAHLILILLFPLALSMLESGFQTCYGIREERWAAVQMVHYVGECLESIQKKHQVGNRVLTIDPLPLLGRAFETFPRTEMGPFSLYWGRSQEETEYYGVIQEQQIERWVETQEPDLILYTPHFFALQNPSLKKTPEAWRQHLLQQIQKYYHQAQVIGGYGQLHETLEIYVRKPQ